MDNEFLEIKPKLKKAYPVVYQENAIIVGGFGKNVRFTDPTGAVKLVFEQLDGKHSIEQITNLITDIYPSITKKDIYSLLNDLNSERFIEDADHIGADVLDDYSLERYHRNINFFSSFLNLEENQYITQKKIEDTTIGILGLGGLGSHILYDLAGLGFGHIKAIEFDNVELSNLNRQILYNESDIGEKKSEKAFDRMKQFNPKIDFQVIDHWVTGAKDIEDAFSDVDSIILVADRPKYLMGNWANEAAVHLNVPLFAAGIEAQRALYHTIVPHVTGCAICWQQMVAETDPISDLILSEKRRLNLVGDNTAITPLVSAATGLLVTEILRYVTGIGELQAAGKEISIDFLTMQTKVSETWELAESCPVCGGKMYAETLSE